MRPLGGAFLWGIVLVAGTTNFVVKHTVQGLDDELNGTRRKTVAAQKQIHDLTAEWTYLNQPELLSNLNRRFVGLVPVAPKQIQRTVDDIPLRPVTAPPDPAADDPQSVATAMPAPTAAATPAVPSPIVPVAATSVTRIAPAVPSAPAANTAAPNSARSASPSLDALFAQVAGEH